MQLVASIKQAGNDVIGDRAVSRHLMKCNFYFSDINIFVTL